MKKTFQQLNLSNAFLFAAALEDEETCRLVLEIILGTRLPKVKVHPEQSNDEYVSRLTEESIIRLHEKVTELKTWRKLEARYMTVEEWMKDRMRDQMEEQESRVREETEQEARREDIFTFLEEYGAIPEHIRKAVSAQEDLAVLKRWLKLAARAGSVEQFEKEM